jgi:ATP-dependent RNA helicase RhlE
MLDMGFLPDIRRILQHVPKKRQTLLFSATLPTPIVQLAGDMLQNPVSLNIERKSAPAAGITHVAYPVPHELKSVLFLELVKSSASKHVLAFTRTKHRANRLADFLEKHGVTCERIHGNRSQAQRTDALASFKRGRCRVLVATDIAARGIDVEGLGLVVNFDVPQLSEDYIHRVGRTGRVDATGDAYTLVSPNEEDTLRLIERAIGTRLPRQKVPGFNYAHTPAERFEIPLADRIAAIRARKAEERIRAKANAARRATQGIAVGPAGNGTAAGQNPRSNRSASPSRWSRKPVTGKSFSRPVSGRLNGKADWRSNDFTTETRGAQRT